MSAAYTERLVDIARAAREAGHGNKEAIYSAACKELAISRPTLLRELKKVADTKPRKRRSDAGETALKYQEAQLIAAYIKNGIRQNGKHTVTLESAVEILRANDQIKAQYFDEASGEVRLLSTSTIRRAIASYGLSEAILNAPAPSIQMASKHPNHVWEIDASLCILFYLPTAGGLTVMEAREFEKNKPENYKRIEKDRVWRYVVTDHASGAIYVEYVFGGESGANLVNIFLNAIQQRGDQPFYGVPFMIYVDAGCANTSGMFKALCRALSIRLDWHMPGNARATGSVEKAQDIVECKFESLLKDLNVQSLDELNTYAQRWMVKFNGSMIHSRHRMTRFSAWMKITQDQLRIAPALELCRELARTVPESRVVNDELTISFKGADFDVSHVPGLYVGQKILVCQNPWRPEAAQVVLNEDGHDRFYIIEQIQQGAFGFRIGAPIIGESFKSHAATPAQIASKQLDQIITGETTDEAIAKSKKEKRPAFGGRIDPFKHLDNIMLPTYLPRKGTALNVPGLSMPEIKTMDSIDLKMQLRNRLGRAATNDELSLVNQVFKDGVFEHTLDEVVKLLKQPVELPKVASLK